MDASPGDQVSWGSSTCVRYADGQGIVYAGWDPNWFRFFLGAMLLIAVLLNLNVKRMSDRM